ncbi:MAG: septum formation protein Maf [Acidobacteria bacterium]|nr:septum formation protein Maf [Acidobacteriota bacterium]
MRLLLASASPRRADLLASAGFVFGIEPVEIDERPLPGEDPSACALRLAGEKAAAAARRHPDAVVVGADTIVVIDGLILGKPSDDGQAGEMLGRLSGRCHEVITGVSIHAGGRDVSAVERTLVWFLPMTAAEIAWYVESGEPRDKAGAYAVQGLASRFIDRIEGSYSNIVGLPVARVYQLLRLSGVTLAPAVVDRGEQRGYSGMKSLERLHET